MYIRKSSRGRIVALALAAAASVTASAASRAQAFNLDHGNAPVEVVIPAVIPVVFASVAPSDATLVLRTTTLLTNAFFDAIAPYHPTAVGVYSRLPRRPAAEGQTDRNRNIAVFYAALEVATSLYPAERERWRQMLVSVGLDPDLASNDLSTPAGIGRAAGRAVVAVREHDGMNQLGDFNGREFNRVPYADTTGYRPVNTAYALDDPSRWQPAVTSRGTGIFSVQQFVTPQYAHTLPYSYHSPAGFRVSPPIDSNPNGNGGRARYKAQADVVLHHSAALNDERKMLTEIFNNKIRSLGFVALFLSQSRNWRTEQFVQYDFLVNLAAFDGGIAIWNEKARHDAVRPFSAIRWLYGDRPVRAWGGSGRGTAWLPADQWTSYLPVADHPEYPSASTCFCAAHAQASRRFLGSDALGWAVSVPAGSSEIEPGTTPATDLVLNFGTWTQFADICGQSRLWAGVHFQAAIDASKPVCTRIGNRAYRFLQRHITGQVPPAGAQVEDD